MKNRQIMQTQYCNAFTSMRYMFQFILTVFRYLSDKTLKIQVCKNKDGSSGSGRGFWGLDGVGSG
jgi:hypothetical protein